MSKSPIQWHRVVRCRDPVCSLDMRSSINRATFKMRELAELLPTTPVQRITLLAEAPGGFLQACKRRWPAAECIGTSLQSEGAIAFDERVRHAVLPGLPSRGDICIPEVVESIVDHMGYASCDLVTADGGAEAHDLDLAEQESVCLILAQVATALRLQRVGGSFIVKIFEGSTDAVRDVFQLLVGLYDRVHLVKPKTSRAGNSERYIVCCALTDEKRASDTATALYGACQVIKSGQWLHRLCTTRIPRVDEAFEEMARTQCAELRSLLSAVETRLTTHLDEARERDANWLVANLGLSRYQRPQHHRKNFRRER